MKTHTIHADAEHCHASFSASRDPILTVEPGDVVEIHNIPDLAWGVECPSSPTAPRRRLEPSDRSGPCLCGPIGVRGARAGATLAIEIQEIVPGPWGFTWAGSRQSATPEVSERFGVGDEPLTLMRWAIDAGAGLATNRLGQRVPLTPFHGCIGLAPSPELATPADPWKPRRTGGNMDCRHLTAGATLLLPIEAEGALLSVGDTHGAQGDGELSGTAIECMAARSRLRLSLIDRPVAGPVALTPAGLVIPRFGATADEAVTACVNAMLDCLSSLLAMGRADALALASAAAHVHITQVVNGVTGAHALLPIAFLDANTLDLRPSLGMPH